jgi:hypothetical protein
MMKYKKIVVLTVCLYFFSAGVFLSVGAFAEENEENKADNLFILPLQEDIHQITSGPGKNTSFGVLLTNMSYVESTYSVNVVLPSGWISTSPTLVSLLPGHRNIFQIQFQSSKNAVIGSEEIITLLVKNKLTGFVMERMLVVKIQDSLSQDTDQDGVPDEMEEEYNTDPYFPDTDRDGMFDGVELFSLQEVQLEGDTSFALEHSDITYQDLDNDGLSDRYEKKYNLDEKNQDTDGDGILDGIETEIIHEKNIPRDGDGNGIPDVLEYELEENIPLEEIHNSVPSVTVSERENDGSQSNIQPEKSEKILARSIIEKELFRASISMKDDFIQKISEAKKESLVIVFGTCGSFFFLATFVFVIAKMRKREILFPK